MTSRKLPLYYMLTIFIMVLFCAFLFGFATIILSASPAYSYFMGMGWGMVLFYNYSILHEIWKEYRSKENEPIIPEPKR